MMHIPQVATGLNDRGLQHLQSKLPKGHDEFEAADTLSLMDDFLTIPNHGETLLPLDGCGLISLLPHHCNIEYMQ